MAARNWNDRVKKATAERKRIGKRVAAATATVAILDEHARERDMIESRIAAALAAACDDGAREAIARKAEMARMALAERHRRQAEKVLKSARTGAGADMTAASYAQSELARRYEKEIADAERAYRERREREFAAQNWMARGSEKNALSHRLAQEMEAQRAEMRARHDMEIARLIEAERRIEAERQDPAAAFDRYHDAVQADVYRLATIKFVEAPGRAKEARTQYLGDREVDGTPHLWTPDELRDAGMSEVQRRATRGENVYLMPRSASSHFLVVDDLTSAKCERLVADGYRPAAVIESSPGNFQAILVVPKISGPMDGDAANALVRRLNQTYGDPYFAGAEHLHRAPGFNNYKDKHRDAAGAFPAVRLVEAESRICEKASGELTALREANVNRPAPVIAAVPGRPVTEGQADAAPGVDMLMSAEYLTAPQDTLVFRFMMHWQNASARIRGAQNKSHVDFHVGVRMRATGHSMADVALAVEIGGPVVRPPEEQGKHAWSKYGRRVARDVFGPAGDRAFESAQRFVDAWRRDEDELDREIERRARRDCDGPEF